MSTLSSFFSKCIFCTHFITLSLAAVSGNLGDFERTTAEGLEKSIEDALQKEDKTSTQTNNPQLLIPNFSYNPIDCYSDFRSNPGGVLEVGGSAEVDNYPLWKPKGNFPIASEPMGRVALIGHSAGGKRIVYIVYSYDLV